MGGAKKSPSSTQLMGPKQDVNHEWVIVVFLVGGLL